MIMSILSFLVFLVLMSATILLIVASIGGAFYIAMTPQTERPESVLSEFVRLLGILFIGFLLLVGLWCMGGCNV